MSNAWASGEVEVDISDSQALVDGIVARTLPVEFTDEDGYIWSGAYSFALGNPRKAIESSSPGRARLTVDVVAVATMTNTTPGRDGAMPVPGRLHLLAPGTDEELEQFNRCEDGGVFATSTCILDGLTLDFTQHSDGSAAVPGPAGQAVRNQSEVTTLQTTDLPEAGVDRLVADLVGAQGFTGFELSFDTGTAGSGFFDQADYYLTFDAAGAEVGRCEGPTEGSGSPVDLCFAQG